MIFGLVLVALITMAVMVTMAVRKKSDKITRIAAIIALGVMILTVIICVIVIFSDTTVTVDYSRLIVGEESEPVKKESGNTVAIILLIVFLIAVFVIVAILSMKEAKKHSLDDLTSSKSISNW